MELDLAVRLSVEGLDDAKDGTGRACRGSVQG